MHIICICMPVAPNKNPMAEQTEYFLSLAARLNQLCTVRKDKSTSRCPRMEWKFEFEPWSQQNIVYEVAKCAVAHVVAVFNWMWEMSTVLCSDAGAGADRAHKALDTISIWFLFAVSATMTAAIAVSNETLLTTYYIDNRENDRVNSHRKNRQRIERMQIQRETEKKDSENRRIQWAWSNNSNIKALAHHHTLNTDTFYSFIRLLRLRETVLFAFTTYYYDYNFNYHIR